MPDVELFLALLATANLSIRLNRLGQRARRDFPAIGASRDVIRYPITADLDVSGWELRKALRLLRKSNAPLHEWPKSPVVDRHDPVFAAEFGALAAEFYSPRRCFAHYLHMAFGNWRDYLRGREELSLKKYLYVFRPLLRSLNSSRASKPAKNSPSLSRSKRSRVSSRSNCRDSRRSPSRTMPPAKWRS